MYEDPVFLAYNVPAWNSYRSPGRAIRLLRLSSNLSDSTLETRLRITARRRARIRGFMRWCTFSRRTLHLESVSSFPSRDVHPRVIFTFVLKRANVTLSKKCEAWTKKKITSNIDTDEGCAIFRGKHVKLQSSSATTKMRHLTRGRPFKFLLSKCNLVFYAKVKYAFNYTINHTIYIHLNHSIKLHD